MVFTFVYQTPLTKLLYWYILIVLTMLQLLSIIPSDDPAPRYKQVQAVLRGLINSGKLTPGEKIAAETQIASALGVSKMTVNKALLALAAEGVFVREVGRGTFVARPDTHAPPKPRTVAVSFVEGARNVLESDYYAALYRGIGESFSDAPEVHLNVSPVGVTDYVAEERSRLDGRLVVAPRRESVPSLNALWQAEYPVVVLGASWPDLVVPCVDSNNMIGAQNMVLHLIEQGHTNIALLFAEPETANTQERIAGYRAALQAKGLPINPANEVQARAAWKAGEQAQKHLVGLMRGDFGPKVTAVFAGGYYLALEVMNAVRSANLSVPSDVAVAGFDDPLSAQLMYPPLTTVRPPLYQMGKRAGEWLLDLVRGNVPLPHGTQELREILPAEIMVRGSTAGMSS